VLCPRRHGHFIRAECLGDNSTMKAEESCVEENNMTISGSSKAFVKQTETYPWQHKKNFRVINGGIGTLNLDCRVKLTLFLEIS